jgi:hypothetical protein
VSEQTAINSATLYRIETAKVRPQRRTLIALLDKYGVDEEARRAELVALSREVTELGWLQAFGAEVSEQYRTFISFEAEARSVRNHETLFVPGLLQTEDYARALISGTAPLVSDQKVERLVQLRLRRQALLSRKPPLELWAIVDEAALHRLVGGPAVMTAQLQHLIRAAREPNVTLQVLPHRVGAHQGMDGPFVVMDFPHPADTAIVYIDSMAGQVFLETEADARGYGTIFEHLRAHALGPADSVRLVGEVAETIES